MTKPKLISKPDLNLEQTGRKKGGQKEEEEQEEKEGEEEQEEDVAKGSGFRLAGIGKNQAKEDKNVIVDRINLIIKSNIIPFER